MPVLGLQNLIVHDFSSARSYRWACLCQAFCPCLHPLVTGPNRYQLKHVLGIEQEEPSNFLDLCMHCWLPCCSVLQVSLSEPMSVALASLLVSVVVRFK